MLRFACLASSALVVLGCTRINPGFGDGSDGATSDPVTSDETATIDPSVSSVSASTDVSESDSDSDSDPTDDTGDMARCGDGVKDVSLGEQCDEGDDSNRDDGHCQPDCTRNECGDMHTSPVQPCDDGPQGSNTCTPECTLRSCGNNVFDEELEECEPGLTKPEVCTELCTLNECGDEQVLGDEQCDDGNGSSDDDCVECQHAICGDGFIRDEKEQCDDSNAIDTDQCTSACLFAECGDGFLYDGEEECDGSQGLSCASLGMNGEAIACDQETCELIGCSSCGDGTVEGDEMCEPGESAACLLEDVGVDIACGADCTWPDASECCIPNGSDCVIGLDCCSGQCNKEQVCAGG